MKKEKIKIIIKIFKHFPAISLNKTLAKIYSNPVPVALMYHSVSDAPFLNAIEPSIFHKQLNILDKKNRKGISPENLYTICEKDTLLTFDDGYLDNYEVVYPLLEKYNYKAIVFVITGTIGKKFKNLSMLSKHHIREMAESGLFKIGAHTVNHPKLNKLSYKEQKFEIEYSKKFLEDLLGMEIVDFAYPFGKYNEITLKILQELEFKRAYTVNPGSLNSIGNPFLIPKCRF